MPPRKLFDFRSSEIVSGTVSRQKLLTTGHLSSIATATLFCSLSFCSEPPGMSATFSKLEMPAVLRFIAAINLLNNY